MQAAFCPPESNNQLLLPLGRPRWWLLDINCCKSSEDIVSLGSFLDLFVLVSYDDVFDLLFVRSNLEAIGDDFPFNEESKNSKTNRIFHTTAQTPFYFSCCNNRPYRSSDPTESTLRRDRSIANVCLSTNITTVLNWNYCRANSSIFRCCSTWDHPTSIGANRRPYSSLCTELSPPNPSLLPCASS